MEKEFNADKIKLLQSVKKSENKKRTSRSQPSIDERPEKTRKILSQPTRQDKGSAGSSAMDTSDLIAKWKSIMCSQSMSTKEARENMALKEVKEEVTRAETEIKRLKNGLETAQTKQFQLSSLNNEYKQSLDQIVEKLKPAWELMTEIQEYVNQLDIIQTECEEQKNKLKELYDNTIVKQKELNRNITQESTNKINKLKEDATKEKVAIQRRLEEKTSELVNLQSKFIQASQNVSGTSKKLEEAEQLLQMKEAELQSLTNNMAVQMKKVSEMESDNAKMKSMNDDLQTRMTDERNEMIKSYEEQKTKLLEEKHVYAEEKEEFNRKYKELQLSKEDVERQLKKVEQVTKDLSEAINSHEHTISTLELEKADYRKNIQELMDQCSAGANENGKLATKIEEQAASLTEAQQMIKHFESNLHEKYDEILGLNSQLRDLEKKNIELSDSVKQIEQKVKEGEEKRNMLNNQLKESEVKYKSSLTEKGMEKASMLEELDQLRSDVAGLKENISRIQRERNTKEAEYEEKLLDSSHLLKEVQSAFDKKLEYQNRQLKKLEKELAEQLKTNENSREHITKMDTEYSCEKAKLEAELQSVKAKIKAMTTQIADDAQMKTKFVQCQDDLKTLKETQKKSEQAYKNKMKELSEQMNKYDKLKVEYETYRDTKEKQLTDAKAELSLQKKNFDKLMEEHETMKKNNRNDQSSNIESQTMPRTSTPKSILKSPDHNVRTPTHSVQFNFSASSDTSSIDALPPQVSDTHSDWLYSNQISSTKPFTVAWPPRTTDGRPIHKQGLARKVPLRTYKNPEKEDLDNPYIFK